MINYKRDPNYGPDSLQPVFSSGKSVAAICMACLIDRGLLNYNDRVSRHWPGMYRSTTVLFVRLKMTI